MADYTPLFKPGAAVTFHVSAAVTGGQLVEVTGDRAVGPSGAASTKVVGVAGFDAAVGEDVTVYSGGIQLPTAGGAIAVGDRVEAAANGQVVTGSTAPVGTAVTAGKSGEIVQIKFDS